ncbi:hypothetical protein B0O80DRAFT_471603 [Mortierella sp. GBAus27b]|nr:hypothetical protein B0O80DRAFT_471603 [Mortierella sp. GBAus27b]
MVNAIDLFPTHAQGHVAEHELPRLISSGNTSSTLVIDLPLRYVFQYALNHIRKDEQNPRRRTVLIVVDSKAKLKSLMRREQQWRQQSDGPTRQEEGGDRQVHSSATDQASVTVDPWQHLFLPHGGSYPQDEFTSATQSQPLTQQMPSQSDPQRQEHLSTTSLPHERVSGSEDGLVDRGIAKEEYQPELWSRIQIRYAPTVYHVQSLFRCLHLDSDTSFGKTFGYDDGEADNPIAENQGRGLGEHGREEEREPTTGSRQLPQSVSMPTMVMLIGCFGDRRPREAVGTNPSSLCVLPNHLPYTGDVSVDDPSIDAATKASETTSTTADLTSAQQPFPSMSTQTPLQVLATKHANEDRERVEYIRAVSQTMSEVKDGIDWIERASGQKVELLVFEDSGSSTSVQDTANRRVSEPREHWLLRVIGFWIDTVVTVEPVLEQIHDTQQDGHNESTVQQVESSAKVALAQEWSSMDSLCLWARPRQSIQVNASNPAAVNATHMSATVGLSWSYDVSRARFRFQAL